MIVLKGVKIREANRRGSMPMDTCFLAALYRRHACGKIVECCVQLLMWGKTDRLVG
jgi:hypothetical protein